MSPFGQVGDRLWVRETWGLWDTEPKDGPENAKWFYRASDGDRLELRHQKWRPSIHMPRWASRILLEVTAVRVERVQDITEADAEQEGDPKRGIIASENTHVDWFREVWDACYSARGLGWNENPWVWVVEFKVVEA